MSRHVTIIVVALLIAIASGVHAQSSHPQFQEASIKPTTAPPRPLPGSGQTLMAPITVAGGRLLVRNITLRALTQFAYGEAPVSNFAAVYTIVGGPPFIDEERYDVEARFDKGASLEVARAMMRSLLEERFGLAVHAESREIPVYHLVIGKDGLKMTQLLAEPARSLVPVTLAGRPAFAYSAPMSTFLNLAQDRVDRLVIDKTGLTGVFEIVIADDEVNASVATGGVPAPVDPLSRFEDQTGLRLVPAKESVEVLVVDHAEKPTEK